MQIDCGRKLLIANCAIGRAGRAAAFTIQFVAPIAGDQNTGNDAKTQLRANFQLPQKS